MTTHFNNRLVQMARTAADAKEIEFNIIKNDHVEAERAGRLNDDIARLRSMASRWEQNPLPDPA